MEVIMRKAAFLIATVLCMVMIYPTIGLTQPPPMLPGTPDQAPLGGLSLLTAAGAAYAWKKLSSRKK